MRVFVNAVSQGGCQVRRLLCAELGRCQMAACSPFPRLLSSWGFQLAPASETSPAPGCIIVFWVNRAVIFFFLPAELSPSDKSPLISVLFP